MGMYTELHFNSRLRENIPLSILQILQYMLGERKEDIYPINNDLFQSDRWKYMLTSDSYYFDAETHSTLNFDKDMNQWYLCIRCNLKNYCGEIEKFIEWIMPYLDKDEGDFIGFYRYEESQNPTLIHYKI